MNRAEAADAISPKRIGAVYVWLIAIGVFWYLKPDAFPTSQTVDGIASQYAVPGLAAVAIIVSLACGSFDLTIGANIGLSGMVFAMVSEHVGSSSWLPFVAGLGAGLGVGLANVLVVVVFEVDAFVATLAMTAVIDAVALGASGGNFITVQPTGAIRSLDQASVGDLRVPIFYLILIALALAYWLERTTSGRYIYAIGFSRESAELTGLPVAGLRTAGFLTSALIGSFAGVLYTIQIGSSSPGDGDQFLIPAFSAAFLGATQIRPGRFNPWGTLIAVFVLATCEYGITTCGGAPWTVQLFQGIVLLTAITLARVGGRRVIDIGRVLAPLRQRRQPKL